MIFVQAIRHGWFMLSGRLMKPDAAERGLSFGFLENVCHLLTVLVTFTEY